MTTREDTSPVNLRTGESVAWTSGHEVSPPARECSFSSLKSASEWEAVSSQEEWRSSESQPFNSNSPRSDHDSSCEVATYEHSERDVDSSSAKWTGISRLQQHANSSWPAFGAMASPMNCNALFAHNQGTAYLGPLSCWLLFSPSTVRSSNCSESDFARGDEGSAKAGLADSDHKTCATCSTANIRRNEWALDKAGARKSHECSPEGRLRIADLQEDSAPQASGEDAAQRRTSAMPSSDDNVDEQRDAEAASGAISDCGPLTRAAELSLNDRMLLQGFERGVLREAQQRCKVCTWDLQENSASQASDEDAAQGRTDGKQSRCDSVDEQGQTDASEAALLQLDFDVQFDSGGGAEVLHLTQPPQAPDASALSPGRNVQCNDSSETDPEPQMEASEDSVLHTTTWRRDSGSSDSDGIRTHSHELESFGVADAHPQDPTSQLSDSDPTFRPTPGRSKGQSNYGSMGSETGAETESAPSRQEARLGGSPAPTTETPRLSPVLAMMDSNPGLAAATRHRDAGTRLGMLPQMQPGDDAAIAVSSLFIAHIPSPPSARRMAIRGAAPALPLPPPTTSAPSSPQASVPSAPPRAPSIFAQDAALSAATCYPNIVERPLLPPVSLPPPPALPSPSAAAGPPARSLPSDHPIDQAAHPSAVRPSAPPLDEHPHLPLDLLPPAHSSQPPAVPPHQEPSPTWRMPDPVYAHESPVPPVFPAFDQSPSPVASASNRSPWQASSEESVEPVGHEGEQHEAEIDKWHKRVSVQNGRAGLEKWRLRVLGSVFALFHAAMIIVYLINLNNVDHVVHLIWMEFLAWVFFAGVHYLVRDVINGNEQQLSDRQLNMFFVLDLLASTCQGAAVFYSALLLNTHELSGSAHAEHWKTELGTHMMLPQSNCTSGGFFVPHASSISLLLPRGCGQLQPFLVLEVVGGSVLLLVNALRPMQFQTVCSAGVKQITQEWPMVVLGGSLFADVLFPCSGMVWLRVVDIALRGPLLAVCCILLILNVARWRLWVSGAVIYQLTNLLPALVLACCFISGWMWSAHQDEVGWLERARVASAENRVAFLGAFLVGWASLLCCRAAQGRQSLQGLSPWRIGPAVVFVPASWLVMIDSIRVMVVSEDGARAWTRQRVLVQMAASVALTVCLHGGFVGSTGTAARHGGCLERASHLYLWVALAWTALKIWDLREAVGYVDVNFAAVLFMHALYHVGRAVGLDRRRPKALEGQEQTWEVWHRKLCAVIAAVVLVWVHDAHVSGHPLPSLLVLATAAAAAAAVLHEAIAPLCTSPQLRLYLSAPLMVVFWVVMTVGVAGHSFVLVFDDPPTLHAPLAVVIGAGIMLVPVLWWKAKHKVTCFALLADCVMAVLAARSMMHQSTRNEETLQLAERSFWIASAEFVLVVFTANAGQDLPTLARHLHALLAAVPSLLLLALKLWVLPVCQGWVPSISLVLHIHVGFFGLYQALALLAGWLGSAEKTPEARGLWQLRGPLVPYMLVTCANFSALVWVLYDGAESFVAELGLGAATWALVLLIQRSSVGSLTTRGCSWTTFAQHGLQATFVGRLVVRCYYLPPSTRVMGFSLADKLLIGGCVLCILALRCFFWFTIAKAPAAGPERTVAAAPQPARTFGAVQITLKIMLHFVAIAGFTWEAFGSHGKSWSSIANTVAAVLSVLILDALFRMTPDPKTMWIATILWDTLIQLPPLLVQAVLEPESYTGRLLQSTWLAFELLFLMHALGFDILIVVQSQQRLSGFASVSRLMPAVAVGLSSAGLMSFSLFSEPDTKLVWAQCVVCCLASFCAFWFSALFVTDPGNGWPVTKFSLLLENVFAGVLSFNVLLHAYLLRNAADASLKLYWAYGSTHLFFLLVLMAWRSLFRDDWRAVSPNTWKMSFTLGTLDVLSVFALFFETDGDSMEFAWYLFVVFAVNVVVFEAGQNFWKSDLVVWWHLAIFNCLTDVPLAVWVIAKALEDGTNWVQVLTLALNGLILAISVRLPIRHCNSSRTRPPRIGSARRASCSSDTIFLMVLQVWKVGGVFLALWLLLFPESSTRLYCTVRVSGIQLQDFGYSARQQFKIVVASGLSRDGVRPAHVQIPDAMGVVGDVLLREFEMEEGTAAARRLLELHTSNELTPTGTTPATGSPTTTPVKKTTSRPAIAESGGSHNVSIMIETFQETVAEFPIDVVQTPRAQAENAIDVSVMLTIKNPFAAMAVSDALERYVVSGALSEELREWNKKVKSALLVMGPHIVDEAECGDKVKDAWEECDDGNDRPSDGCSPACSVEEGYLCQSEQPGLTSSCSISIGELMFDPAPGSYSLNALSSPMLQIHILGSDVSDLNIEYTLGNASFTYTSPIVVNTVLSVLITAVGRKAGYTDTPLLVGRFEVTAVCGDGRVDGDEECDDRQPVDVSLCTQDCTASMFEKLEFTPTPGIYSLNKWSSPQLEVRIAFRLPVRDGSKIRYWVSHNSSWEASSISLLQLEEGLLYRDALVLRHEALWFVAAVGERHGRATTPWLVGRFEVLGVCGDGLATAKESCDDGNDDDQDGCTRTCDISPGLPLHALDASPSTEAVVPSSHALHASLLPFWVRWLGLALCCSTLAAAYMDSLSVVSVPSAPGPAEWQDPAAVEPAQAQDQQQPLQDSCGACGDVVRWSQEHHRDEHGNLLHLSCHLRRRLQPATPPSPSTGSPPLLARQPSTQHGGVRGLCLECREPVFAWQEHVLYDSGCRVHLPCHQLRSSATLAASAGPSLHEGPPSPPSPLVALAHVLRSGLPAAVAAADARHASRAVGASVGGEVNGAAGQPILRCAICDEDFTAAEGVSCNAGLEECEVTHFLCAVCLRTYVRTACETGGAMPKVITNANGIVTSDAGRLPCPFFPIQCNAGELPEQRVASLLDNATFECYRAAQRRIGVDEFLREQEEREAALARQQAAERGDLVAIARQRVVAALEHGQSVLCPGCHNSFRKDDACIHMACTCGVHFCYICGRDRYPGVVGNRAADGHVPANRRSCGCDERSIYLQNHPGWSNFARPGESAAHGALIEFHRRRMAFFVRAAKESVPPRAWQQLQEEHPSLLTEVLDGRSIEWEEVETAEHPQIGNGRAREEAQRMAEELQRQWWEGAGADE